MKPTVAFFTLGDCADCGIEIADLKKDLSGILTVVDSVDVSNKRGGSQVPPPQVVACFNAAESRVKTRKHSGAFASRHAPLAEPVVSGNACNASAIDIALVQGYVSKPHDEALVRSIRQASGILVACGACAARGSRNAIPRMRRKSETSNSVSSPKVRLPADNAKALHEIVAVDYKIHGCPIVLSDFLRIVKALAFGTIPDISDYPVCMECKSAGIVCIFDTGDVCVGPITHAGCNALCPANGSPCIGCRGTVCNPNWDSMREVLAVHNISDSAIRERFAARPGEIG